VERYLTAGDGGVARIVVPETLSLFFLKRNYTGRTWWRAFDERYSREERAEHTSPRRWECGWLVNEPLDAQLSVSDLGICLVLDTPRREL
jgi:hypothetical protein